VRFVALIAAAGLLALLVGCGGGSSGATQSGDSLQAAAHGFADEFGTPLSRVVCEPDGEWQRDSLDTPRAIAYCYDNGDPDRVTGGCFLTETGEDVTVPVKNTEGIGSHRCTS
jgi:hypothetical protein